MNSTLATPVPSIDKPSPLIPKWAKISIACLAAYATFELSWTLWDVRYSPQAAKASLQIAADIDIWAKCMDANPIPDPSSGPDLKAASARQQNFLSCIQNPKGVAIDRSALAKALELHGGSAGASLRSLAGSPDAEAIRAAAESASLGSSTLGALLSQTARAASASSAWNAGDAQALSKAQKSSDDALLANIQAISSEARRHDAIFSSKPISSLWLSQRGLFEPMAMKIMAAHWKAMNPQAAADAEAAILQRGDFSLLERNQKHIDAWAGQWFNDHPDFMGLSSKKTPAR